MLFRSKLLDILTVILLTKITWIIGFVICFVWTFWKLFHSSNRLMNISDYQGVERGLRSFKAALYIIINFPLLSMVSCLLKLSILNTHYVTYVNISVLFPSVRVLVTSFVFLLLWCVCPIINVQAKLDMAPVILSRDTYNNIIQGSLFSSWVWPRPPNVLITSFMHPRSAQSSTLL